MSARPLSGTSSIGRPKAATEDDGPGVVSGDGFADVFAGQPFEWHVAGPDGVSTSTPQPSGPGYSLGN